MASISESLSALSASLLSACSTLQAEINNGTVLDYISRRLSSTSLEDPSLFFTYLKESFNANQNLYLLVLTGFATLLLASWLSSPMRKLPPGPRGHPLIGNLLAMTGTQLWLRFTEWRETYGDLVTLNIPGQRIIVINSQAAANEILERRAGKNSDRPRNIVAAEILTGGLLFVFTRYTDVWRRMRKAAHEGLNRSVVHRYQPGQASEGYVLAAGLLSQPEEWFKHLRRNAASSIMSTVYDTPPIESEQDSSVKRVNDFVARLATAGKPGAHLVEVFPSMMYIPRRFAKWRTDAEEWHVKDTNMFVGLFNKVRDRMAEGEDRPSLTATLIEDSGRHGLSENENAWVAATMYAAGSETTSGVMAWWIFAMCLHPEFQKRAQAEIDTVVGRDRLPTFADSPHLPYCHAMAKEALRWRPVDPLGMPHYTIEDDWYEGMYIPKGTVLLANVWHLNRDPNLYGPDAHLFNPERWLDAKGGLVKGPAEAKEDGHSTYGFGRRICVGRHVADNSLFINIASILWAMNLEKNSKIETEEVVEDGLVVRPKLFDIKVTPRFPEAAIMLGEAKTDFFAQHT
ncbi:cytochrome P450 [Dendrothele bispora CBS 962.96]|uniref:Cytochrome P450 n=1 Tax=Dendrothele bispora (strain CBS 962.96) TaxID=1314807 RepID=A0A4S8L187_DENBC|nr:cytochrome P450 [Dendrothele bispora CBS 962.96]